MTRDEVFAQIRAMMVEMFELEESDVTLEAKVFEDLDLDSIDAIDLVARLQQLSGRRVEEEKLREVRTVQDIVDLVAEQLEQAAADGIDVEVIDLLSLRPLDMETVLASVRKTNRAVVGYHGWRLGGVGPEIVDQIQRDAFDWLDAPVLRVCYDDIPMAYAENLEHLSIPQPDGIYAAVRKVLYRD